MGILIWSILGLMSFIFYCHLLGKAMNTTMPVELIIFFILCVMSGPLMGLYLLFYDNSI